MAVDRQRALIGWSITVAIVLFIVGVAAVIRHHDKGTNVATPPGVQGASSLPTAPTSTLPSPSTTAPSPSSTASATTVTVPPTSAAGPTTPPGPPTQCHTANLVMTDAGGQPARGNLYGTIVVVNNGTGPCTLFGYAGMARLDANGAVMPTRVVDDTNVAKVHVLVAPQGQASFGYATAFGTSCAHAAALAVIPPDETTPVTFRSTLPACQPDVTIGPMQKGANASIMSTA
jgi:hypothetical protein